jgi:type IV pilus assembly protein PilZ
MTTEDDRRHGFRAPIELKVEYKRLNTFFADYTRNISRGGTFIGTDKPLKVGTEFVFALGIPHMAEPLRLRGKVIWTTDVEDATKANPAGMGIEFQYGEGERAEKEAAVERLMSAELGEHLATKLLGRKPQL